MTNSSAAAPCRRSPCRLLGDLEVVVVEADQRRSRASRRARSRHRGCRDRPRAASRRGCPRGSSGRPWSACPSLTRWLCGPSARIGWPLPCLTRSGAMIAGPKRKTKMSAVIVAPPVAERDVAEDVEDRHLIGEAGRAGRALGDFLAPAGLRGALAGAKRAFSASTSGPMRLPIEPLTMTTSPGAPSLRAAAVRSSAAVSRIAAAALGGKRLPERLHQRAGEEDAVDRAPRPSCGEAGMKRRRRAAELQHVAEDGDPAAARRRLGLAEEGERRPHRGRVGVVALVDQRSPCPPRRADGGRRRALRRRSVASASAARGEVAADQRHAPSTARLFCTRWRPGRAELVGRPSRRGCWPTRTNTRLQNDASRA